MRGREIADPFSTQFTRQNINNFYKLIHIAILMMPFHPLTNIVKLFAKNINLLYSKNTLRTLFKDIKKSTKVFMMILFEKEFTSAFSKKNGQFLIIGLHKSYNLSVDIIWPIIKRRNNKILSICLLKLDILRYILYFLFSTGTYALKGL